MSLRLVLTGKPVSKKNSWAIAGNRLFMSREARAYQQLVKIQARSQMNAQRVNRIAAPAYVTVRGFVYFTRRQRMDVHNAMETVLDALQGIAYDNDRQVVGHYTPPERLIDDEAPRVEVEIQSGEEAAADPRWAAR